MEKSQVSQYKLTQVFGDKTSAEKVSEEDIISAIKFDQTGKYLSLGDKAGRLIIFTTPPQTKSKKFPEYTYYTQLQSHVKQFDPLKSIDIEQKINDINWLKPQGNNLFVLTTNSKRIKLWKLSQKTIKKVVRSAGKQLNIPKLQVIEEGFVPTLKQSFPNLHNYNINSISPSSNQQYLLSSDDLKIYLWNINQPKKAFIPFQMKPDNMDEINEVITCSSFHPTSDSLFTYATSKGIMKMGDMRISAICDNTAINFRNDQNSPKNFFSDLITNISSTIYLKSEKYIAARDFLTIKIWDVAMTNKPVSIIPIQESLKSKLCEMYQNQNILQKFSLSASSDSKNLLTGNFNSSFHLIDVETAMNMQYEINFNRKTINKQILSKIQALGQMDYIKKISKSTFHPITKTAAVACLNCFFIYNV